MAVGIVNYGTYFPGLRIAKKEYQQAWGSCAADIREKTVMDFDEDTLTMGVEAAREAIGEDVGPDDIDILCWSSTNYPYREKMVSGAAAVMLGLKEDLITTEHGQSTRAGGEAFLTASAFLKSGAGKKALVIASDAPRSNPADGIEHGLGAGSAAYVLGTDNLLAEVEGFTSFVGEMLGDRFRPVEGIYLKDIGVRAFTSASYKRMMTLSLKSLMEKLNSKASDYSYFVAQEIDSRNARSIAKTLGFSEEQSDPGMLYSETGDTGACSAMLNLAAVLDQARFGNRILLGAYGSGAGSLAISLKVTGTTACRQKATVRKQLSKKERYINYVQYLQVRRYL